MHNAVASGNIECVASFLKSTTTNPLADVSLENGDGLTPLHIAVQKSNMDIIRELVNAGADVLVEKIFFFESFNHWTQAYSPLGTPMELAIEQKRMDIASYLKSKIPLEVFNSLTDEHISQIISFLRPIDAIKTRAICKRILSITNQTLCGPEYWEKQPSASKVLSIFSFFSHPHRHRNWDNSSLIWLMECSRGMTTGWLSKSLFKIWNSHWQGPSRTLSPQNVQPLSFFF